MACGTPLIVSNTPRFISELTNNYNALVVEPTESEIASGIKRLLADNEYWNMLSTNIRRKSEECQWEKVAEQLVNEFNSA
jgi:glycosyltransferase involved in cell wall biosynthesis